MDSYIHLIAALAVLSRLADIGTTYLASPTLKLEANSLVRRFGWAIAAINVHLEELRHCWGQALGISGPQWMILMALADTDQADGVPVNLLIAKQRNGPTGDINLTFLRPYTRFESAAKVSDEDVPVDR